MNRWSLTEPSNGITLIDTEAVGSLERRDLSSMEFGKILLSDTPFLGIDLDREGVADFDVELEVFGDEHHHG